MLRSIASMLSRCWAVGARHSYAARVTASSGPSKLRMAISAQSSVDMKGLRVCVFTVIAKTPTTPRTLGTHVRRRSISAARHNTRWVTRNSTPVRVHSSGLAHATYSDAGGSRTGALRTPKRADRADADPSARCHSDWTPTVAHAGSASMPPSKTRASVALTGETLLVLSNHSTGIATPCPVHAPFSSTGQLIVRLCTWPRQSPRRPLRANDPIRTERLALLDDLPPTVWRLEAHKARMRVSTLLGSLGSARRSPGLETCRAVDRDEAVR